MESVVSWRESPHALNKRRSDPDVYVDKASMISAIHARLIALNGSTNTEADLPLLQWQMPATEVRLRSNDKAMFSAYIFPPSVAPNPIQFVYDDKPFTLDFAPGVSGTFVGVLDTTSTHQDLLIMTIDEKRVYTQAIVLRDFEALEVVTTVFRDLDRLDEHDNDVMPLVDGNANDLRWQYELFSTMLMQTPHQWIGVRCPVRVETAEGFVDDTSEDAFMTTHIQRPYVHMRIVFRTPRALHSNDVVLVVETKRSARSVHCEVPMNGTSIGVPAAGDSNGLIVRLHVSDSMLTQMDVLATDFPFRTPLGGAITLAMFAANLFTQDDDFLSALDIAGALDRVERKSWIEPDVEEHPPRLEIKIGSEWPAHTGVSNFTLRYRRMRTSESPPDWHGNSTLVVDAKNIVLPAKDKVRMHASYVFDGKPHKYRLKMKTPRTIDGERTYFFELPGPMHMRLVVSPLGQDAFSIKTLVLDTHRSPPPLTSDDENWAALL